jgi:hypothetical protein
MKKIGIVCVDTLNYGAASRAVMSTVNALKDKVNISTIYWFSDIDFPLQTEYNIVYTIIDKIDPKTLNQQLNDVLLDKLLHLVTEDYIIVVQSDGYAVNSEAWTDEFLNYDYIGATWSWWHEEWKNINVVGNGGFSLRSKKLLLALADLKEPHNNRLEDEYICRIHRKVLEEKYQIKYAPSELANRFSIEHNLSSSWLGKSLGFHGKHGICRHYGVEID